MLSNVKERISFLKSKTIDEYNHTILMPSFNMMELYKNAEYVGLDINNYNLVIKNSKNVHSNDVNYHIMKLVNYLKQIVFDDEFIERCTSKLFLIVNYGNFNIELKSFVGSLNISNQEYKYALEFNINNITYALEFNNTKIRGKFLIQKNGYTIKYEKYYKDVQEKNDKKEVNINNNIIIENYNKLGHEINRYSKVQIYNYYENKNGEKIISNIDPKQNFTKQIYMWRCPSNTIIKSIRVKYQYPKDKSSIEDIEKYLVGKNISPNNNKMPNKGKFYSISKEMFTDYFSGKCDIRALWDEVANYTLIK